MQQLEQDILLISKLEARAERCKRLLNRINDVKRKAEYDAEETRQRIANEMLLDGVKQHSFNDFDINLREPTPVIDVPDIETVPDMYVRIKKEADKTRIKAAAMKGLKANWFTVQDGKLTITIKGKLRKQA